MQNNWKILIVTNGTIVEEYYKNDNFFNDKNWTFFNVGKERLTSDRFSVINSCDIPNYEYLGKEWAESEVIYNICKLDLFKDIDFIGIIHYDFNLYDKRYQTYRITENVDNLLNNKGIEWISFFGANVQNITGFYDVLMDERKPNCLFVRNSNIENPRSCNSYITDFIKNSRFSDTILNGNIPISLCCSFITRRETMFEIGKIMSEIKETKELEKYDTERRHRFCGQFMERLVAIISTNFRKKMFSFNLDHRFTGGLELNKNDPNGENY